MTRLRLVMVLLACAGAPVRLCAQGADLAATASGIAERWRSHDFASLVGGARVEIQIPGVSAAGPVPAEQAVVLLAGYAQGAEEVEVTVLSAMEVSELTAYAELRRRWHPRGVAEVSEARLLVGLVRTREGSGGGAGGAVGYGPWRVQVVRVIGG